MSATDPGTADDGRDVRLPPHHPVLAVLITVAGVVLLAMTAFVTYSLAAMYSSDSGALGSVLIWSLLPAVVIAIGLRHAFQTFARRYVGWPRLLLVSYAVSVLAIGLGAWLGGRTYDSDQARAAAACTTEATAALRSLPSFNAAIDEPTGGRDGLCRVTLAVRSDPGAGLATLTAAMRKDGWSDIGDAVFSVSSDDGGSDTALSKDGVTVVLTQRDEGKNYTDVTAEVLPPG